MNISTLAEYLDRLNNTTKRLEMIDILESLIEQLDPKETKEAIYLISGYLRAPYEGEKFNIADKMMIRVISEAYSTKDRIIDAEYVNKEFQKVGDLGDVAYSLCESGKKADQQIIQVYEGLRDVANLSGGGSQDLKVKKMSEILKSLDNISAKYIVRIVLGTTRLGFTETTIIEALAKMAGNRSNKELIEAKYNIHPDIGYIAEVVKESGIDGLENVGILPGVPILLQKAQRVSGFMDEAVERMGTLWAEFKFDGTRVQLHILPVTEKSETTSLFQNPESQQSVKTYTRNLEETTHQYPDLIEGARKQINASSIIIDGEAIGFDRESGGFLPFQETIQRKRKHNVEETAENIPLKYYVFDILFLNGESLVDKTLRERKDLLRSVIKPGETIKIAEHIETDNLSELEEYFEVAKNEGVEGLIAKNPEERYRAGARSYAWIKLKRADEALLEDSVDCVVLGYYSGKGSRSNLGIGGLLLGIYDPETDSYKTISKVGGGLTEEGWIDFRKKLEKYETQNPPSNIYIDKKFTPQAYVQPHFVVEVGADEISKSEDHTTGYALRFPRILKIREDKSPQESTNIDEIVQMFNSLREKLKRN